MAPPRGDISSNSMNEIDAITLETLEEKIECIIRQILASKPVLATKNRQEGHPEQIVLMINFPEDEEIEKCVISYILESGFIIKHLHTFSSSGIQFINLILKDSLMRLSHESFIDSLQAKFPVNVLLS